jgi:catechol 2,3-dioxygenase-like lactoylglutathione lyase family enzyme
MSDLGLSHIAFVVRDLDRSLDFYARYAGMQVVHGRDGHTEGDRIAWVSDLTRPFVIVLIQAAALQGAPLGPFAHLGVGCATRQQVDQLAALARQEGRVVNGPNDSGPPVGYWATIADPDGNMLELAYGQEVNFTVAEAKAGTP